jgi:hypothetical protein
VVYPCFLPLFSATAGAYLRLPAGNRTVLPPTDWPHRVGIYWAGSPTHVQDALRSSRLADWQSLLELASPSTLARISAVSCEVRRSAPVAGGLP